MAPGRAGPPRPGAGVEAGLAAAAFRGSPRDAVPLLAGLDPAGPVPARTRWLAGVCLGALGRYPTAARFLLPAGPAGAGSLALSCRASHLRQLGRHVEAEPLDQAALAAAADAEARADALAGLVADAVGRLDLADARARLARADADRDAGHYAWRASVRLDWVRAEVALLGDDPSAAVDAARGALRLSHTVAAYRHIVKSQLILGAALDAAGHPRPAARVLRGAAAEAVQLGLPTLVWPARTLRVANPAGTRAADRGARTAAGPYGAKHHRGRLRRHHYPLGCTPDSPLVLRPGAAVPFRPTPFRQVTRTVYSHQGVAHHGG